MSAEPKPAGELTGRRIRTDYHKSMDAGSLAISIQNHLKYTLAKHAAGTTLHDRYWATACAIRDRLVDRWGGRCGTA
jgi:hypothetical protein